MNRQATDWGKCLQNTSPTEYLIQNIERTPKTPEENKNPN